MTGSQGMVGAVEELVVVDGWGWGLGDYAHLALLDFEINIVGGGIRKGI